MPNVNIGTVPVLDDTYDVFVGRHAEKERYEGTQVIDIYEGGKSVIDIVKKRFVGDEELQEIIFDNIPINATFGLELSEKTLAVILHIEEGFVIKTLHLLKFRKTRFRMYKGEAYIDLHNVIHWEE